MSEVTFNPYVVGLSVGRLSIHWWFPWRAWNRPHFRDIYGLGDEVVASALYFGPLDIRWFGTRNEAPR